MKNSSKSHWWWPEKKWFDGKEMQERHLESHRDQVHTQISTLKNPFHSRHRKSTFIFSTNSILKMSIIKWKWPTFLARKRKKLKKSFKWNLNHTKLFVLLIELLNWVYFFVPFNRNTSISVPEKKSQLIVGCNWKTL